MVGWRQAKGTCDLPKGHSTKQENIRDIVSERQRAERDRNVQEDFHKCSYACLSVCLVCMF